MALSYKTSIILIHPTAIGLEPHELHITCVKLSTTVINCCANRSRFIDSLSVYIVELGATIAPATLPPMTTLVPGMYVTVPGPE